MVAMSTRINALDSFGTKSPSKTDPIAAMRAAGGLFPLRKVSLAEWSGKPANPDLFVVVREDTHTVIGQVGKNYECFTNEDFFGPVAKSLVDNTGAQIDRFQMLDNGTRSFMRLSWGPEHNITVGPNTKVGDVVGKRCLISTSHDGKYAGKFILQLLRLACSNGMILPIAPYEADLTHSRCGHTQLRDLGDLVPTIDTYCTQFKKAADLLSATRVDKKIAGEIVTKIVDPTKTGKLTKGGEPNRAMSRVNRILELFDGQQPDADNVAMKGTGWGLYQAAVDYFTHDKGTRGKEENEDEKRFRSLLPGSGAASREIMRAWDVIVDGLEIRPMLKLV